MVKFFKTFSRIVRLTSCQPIIFFCQKALLQNSKKCWTGIFLAKEIDCYDVNAPDAGIHSVLKGAVRNLARAKCVDHIKRDIETVVDAMQNNNPWIIQNAFVKAYSRNEFGDEDQTLVPPQIMEWYKKDEVV